MSKKLYHRARVLCVCNMESRVKNKILSIKRYQRHLKLAFIVADEDFSEKIKDIINWCSFDVRGAGSLIFKVSSLENRFNSSLLKEHDPDILVKVGNVSEPVMKELEKKHLPFGIWDWGEIRKTEDSPTNLASILSAENFPVQESRVSSMREDDEYFLLSAALFGFLTQEQRESLKKRLKFSDVKISKDNLSEILNHQRFGGIINFSRSHYWLCGESYDSFRCYDTFERTIKAIHDCLVIGNIEDWDDFILVWNLRAHFPRRVLFLPSFLFDNGIEVVGDFLWNASRHAGDHNLTILSNSLTVSEIVQLLDSIPNSKIQKQDSTYNLELKRDKESRSFRIELGANLWSEIFGKIRTTFGKVDTIPVYFSDLGGTIEVPEPTIFDPKKLRLFYAVDFEIPFFKPPKSRSLAYRLGLGSRIRISSIGLTSIQGGPFALAEERFVPIRALDPVRMIKDVVSDYGFDARPSSNGEMAIRFFSLLQSLHELYSLSGEDVIGFLKQCNPLLRNDKGKTVKKPDEDAAIDWSRIQEFLNISDKPYIKREFANKIVSWMVRRGLLKLGTKIKCRKCFNKQWIPINQIKQEMQCSACFSGLPKPLGTFDHLKWSYLPNVLLGRAVDQGFLTPLLSIYYLTYENRQSEQKMMLFYPGIDILRDGDHVAELDLFVVSEGEIITGECKIGHDVTEKEIDKLISISEDIGADAVLFCTLDSFSEQCTSLIKNRANRTKLKISVLQSDQLLNQTLDRKLTKLASERKGPGKSYRQIFVEHVTRYL